MHRSLISVERGGNGNRRGGIGSSVAVWPAIVTGLLLLAGGAGCQPTSTAPAGGGGAVAASSACTNVLGAVTGTTSDDCVVQIASDAALAAPAIEIYKLDAPAGQGHTLRTLCPNPEGCDALYAIGETADGLVELSGSDSDPRPEYIVAKATYSTPAENAIGVYFGEWDAKGTLAAHDEWQAFRWNGELRFSARGYFGEGDVTLTFEFWRRDRDASGGADAAWLRSPAGTVTLRAVPNTQCHCCDGCNTTDSSADCGLTSREAAGGCQELARLVAGDASARVFAGGGDPIRAPRAWRLANGDIQMRLDGCQESVIVTPAPDYVTGLVIPEEQAGQDGTLIIRNTNPDQRRIHTYEPGPDGTTLRLVRTAFYNYEVECSYVYDREGRLSRIVSGEPSSSTFIQLTYDDEDRLIRLVPQMFGRLREERAQTLIYDGDRVVGVEGGGCTSCATRQKRIYHDADGRLESITDADGEELERLSYDEAGRLVLHEKRNDANELVVVKAIAYDTSSDGRRTVTVREPVSDTMERIAVEKYDANGRLTRLKEYTDLFPIGSAPSGDALETRYTYSVSRDPTTGIRTRVTEVTNPASVTSVTVLRWFEAPAEAADASLDGAMTRLLKAASGDPSGEPAGMADLPGAPALPGEVTAVASRYLWTYTRGRDGGVTDSEVTASVYNEAAGTHVPVYRVDRRGGATELRYDADGRIAERVLPAVALLEGKGIVRARTTYAYDERGRLRREGRTGAADDMIYTDYEYDEFGRMIGLTANAAAATAKAKSATRYRFNSFGEQTAVIDPRGTVTETVYDEAGRAVDEIVYVDGADDLVLGQTRYEYDDHGNLARVRTAIDDEPFAFGSPKAWSDTTYTYDTAGRRIAESLPGPDGSTMTTTFRYDYQGRQIEQVNPNGSIKRTTYDGLGRKVEEATSGRGVEPVVDRYVYGPDGWLAQRIDASGEATRYEYDEFGRQRSETRGDATRTEYEYDNAGLLRHTEVLDLSDDRVLSDTVVTRDELGRQIVSRRRAVAGVDGKTDAIRLQVFDIEGRKTATIDKAANNTNLREFESGDRQRRTIFDALNRPIATIDPMGTVTENEYDAAGRLVSRTVDPGGLSLTMTYVADARGRTRRVTDPDGHTTVYDFDTRGKPTRVWQVNKDGAPLSQSRLEYDLGGRLTRMIRMRDPASNAAPDTNRDSITERRYHPGGAAGAGKVSHQMVNVGDQVRSTTMTYDGIGRLTRVSHPVDPDTNFETFEYDAKTGRIAAHTISDPMGVRRTEYVYSPSMSEVIVRQIGSDGSPPLESRYTYDGLGRATSVVGPDGNETQVRYNLLGLEIERTEDAGGLARVTRRAYDRHGNLAAVIAADTTAELITEYEYDAAGRRTVTRYPDDGVGGESGEIRQRYDAAGRLLERVDQRGIATRYEYDGRGLMIRTFVPGGGVDHAFAYDGAGRLTDYASDDRNHGHRTYDGLGRLVAEEQTVDGVVKTVSAEYGPAGDRVALTYPADTATVLAFEYDEAGRNTRIRRDGRPVVEYVHHGDFVTQRRVLTDQAVAIETARHYDGHRRTIGIRNVVGETDLISFALDRDAVGSPSSCRQNSDVVPTWDLEYTYDTLGRLTRVDYFGAVTGDERFEYDALGNREHYWARECEPTAAGEGTAYRHNEGNEYTQVIDNDVAAATRYDAAGNLVLDERGYGYEYDHGNRLVRVFADVDGDGVRDAGEAVHAEYTYDALGRRTQTTIDGRTLRYVYDDQSVLVEYDDRDPATPYRWYIHGTTYVDERAVMFTNDPDVGDAGTDDYYYLLGDLDNVVGIVGDRGQLVEAVQYDAYGMPRPYGLAGDEDHDGDVDGRDYDRLTKTGDAGGAPAPPTAGLTFTAASGEAGEIWFTGAIGSAEYTPAPPEAFRASSPGALSHYYFTGRTLDVFDAQAMSLQYSRARHYDGMHGRFLQRDPTGYRDGMNLYNYARSNPTRFVDPWGLESDGKDYQRSPTLGSVQEIKALHGCPCIFTMRTHAYGLPYHDGIEAMVQELLQLNVVEKYIGVGHTWLRLEADGSVIQGGHSGETGVAARNPRITSDSFLYLSTGLLRLALTPSNWPSPMPHLESYADPANPVAWAFYLYEDGFWAPNSASHPTITRECSWCVNSEQARAMKARIHHLREAGGAALAEFGLTGWQCSVTAQSVGEEGGIHFETRVTHDVPRSINVSLFGVTAPLPLWSNRPELSSITFAVPDKSQDEMFYWRGPEAYHKICKP